MTDIVDSQRRSELMAGIRGHDTAPELAVRRIAHRMGLRFRLHRKGLPGRPDLVFPKHRLAVFVHGCFWHHHRGCPFAHVPKSRTAYWREKFEANAARDKRNEDDLSVLGWRVLVLWECEVKDEDFVRTRLGAYTGSRSSPLAVQTRAPDGRKRDGTPTQAEAPGPSRPPPSFVDVFAGCGGLSLGLMRAGWKGLFAVEKDPLAFETLSANLPSGVGQLSYGWPGGIERRNWEIRELLSDHTPTLSQLAGTVDLLAGGPPCQGFSHAGHRHPNDPRNKLFEAYLELVRIVRPRLVLVENVRAFTSDFKASQSKLVENFASALREGLSTDYDVASAVIRASDYGVPQVRPRFILVGALKALAAKERVHAFFDDLARQTASFLNERGLPPDPTSKDALSDLEVARNGTVPSRDSPGFDEIGYSSPITTYQRAMRDGHNGSPPDTRLARHRPDIRDRFAALITAAGEEDRRRSTISADTKKAHGIRKIALRVLDPHSPAPTITSLPDDLLHYSEPRILTVRENARLQSFPDWFEFKGKYTTGGKQRRNQVPRFTQVANAVPPLLAEQLGAVLMHIADASPATEAADERPAHVGQR